MSQSVSPFLTVCDVGLGVWPQAGAASPSPSESASVSARTRLEREIVILGIQSLREICEGFVLGRGLRGRPRRRLRRRERLATITLAGQENQLATVDLRRVPGLPFLVLPGPVLDAALDVDLVALLAVALGDVRKIRALVVPKYDTVPLGLLLLFARGALPLATGRQRQGGDPPDVRRAAHFGVRAQVADQGGAIETAAHDVILNSG